MPRAGKHRRHRPYRAGRGIRPHRRRPRLPRHATSRVRSPTICGSTGQLDADDVRGLGAVLADALATAHSYGIAHAAVSPATVLISPTTALAARRLRCHRADAVRAARRLGVHGAGAPRAAAAAAARSARRRRTCSRSPRRCASRSPARCRGATRRHGRTRRVSRPARTRPVGWWRVRAALAADPDQRPSAEEFAQALRRPAPVRCRSCSTARRSICGRSSRGRSGDSPRAASTRCPTAMRQASGRATAPGTRRRPGCGAAARTHRNACGGGGDSRARRSPRSCAFALVGRRRHGRGRERSGRQRDRRADSRRSLLMSGAREASESWLRKVGAGDMTRLPCGARQPASSRRRPARPRSRAATSSRTGRRCCPRRRSPRCDRRRCWRSPG